LMMMSKRLLLAAAVVSAVLKGRLRLLGGGEERAETVAGAVLEGKAENADDEERATTLTLVIAACP